MQPFRKDFIPDLPKPIHLFFKEYLNAQSRVLGDPVEDDQPRFLWMSRSTRRILVTSVVDDPISPEGRGGYSARGGGIVGTEVVVGYRDVFEAFGLEKGFVILWILLWYYCLGTRWRG